VKFRVLGLGGVKFFFHFVFSIVPISQGGFDVVEIYHGSNLVSTIYSSLLEDVQNFHPHLFPQWSSSMCVCANNITYKFSLITFAMLFATLVQYKTFVEWEAYVPIWTILSSLCSWTSSINVRHFGEFNYTYFTWTFYVHYFFFLHWEENFSFNFF